MDSWQWTLAALAAVLIGIAKAGIPGLSVLPVAIFATVMPARESVGVNLVVLIAGDIVAVLMHRRHANWSQLIRLFPWAVVGIVVGTVTMGRIDDVSVRRLIGVILITLVAIWLLPARRRLEEEASRAGLWFAGLTGVIMGFTTMVSNAAGPIMVLYLLAMKMPKLAFVGTVAWFFLAINLLKVPFSYSLGLISLDSLRLSTALWPLAVGGAFIGRWMLTRIDQKLFERASLVLTLAGGLRLLLA